MKRLVTALALALATTLVAAVSAEAATHSISDRTRDVGNHMDIHNVTIKNGHPLVITVRHRNIAEPGYVAAYIDIGGDSTPTYMAWMGIGTHPDFSWMRSWRRAGGMIGCPYRFSYSQRTEVSRFVLPRSCLNGASFRATRVRVAVTAGGRPGSQKDWAPGYRRYSPWVALG